MTWYTQDISVTSYDCRLGRIWSDELKKHGPTKASLERAVLVFMKTRMIVSLLCILGTVVMQFSVPVSYTTVAYQ